jgi:hypothetical protein
MTKTKLTHKVKSGTAGKKAAKSDLGSPVWTISSSRTPVTTATAALSRSSQLGFTGSFEHQ